MLYIVFYIVGIASGLAIASILVSVKFESVEMPKIEKLKQSNIPDKKEKASVITYLTPEEERQEREDNKIKALFL